MLFQPQAGVPPDCDLDLFLKHIPNKYPLANNLNLVWKIRSIHTFEDTINPLNKSLNSPLDIDNLGIGFQKICFI